MGKTNYLSLRSLFIRWLVLFSLLPLILIVALFVQQFKSTVQDEIFERLIVYTKQVQNIFNDHESVVLSDLNAMAEDKAVLYQLKTSSVSDLKKSLEQALGEDETSTWTVYGRQGELVLRVGGPDLYSGEGPQNLNAVALSILEKQETATNAYYFFSSDKKAQLHLSVVRKIKDEALSWSGYLQKTILFDEAMTKQIKKDQGLDIIFFGPKGEILLTSLADEKFTQEQLSQDFLRGNNHFFDVSLQGQSFGFISTVVSWGEQKFLIAIGASKNALTKSLSRLLYFMMGAFFFLVLCLLVFSYFFTQQVIQPITRLVEGIQKMQTYSEPVQIENKSRTEIGMLTDSFNEMSKTIYGYRSDLELKITDLERANTEVQSTQNQLIQSAKLAGLGQLVAGVAHELNNPIGFVYSNMQHLREYTNVLIAMITELAKKNDNFEKIKQKYDYDFVAKDLPKLIASCEEGARRTRDIVMGLRTFSRSSDKDQKKFSVTDCIDSTLDLLRGAIKNERIKIEKEYDSYVPLIVGNPNQVSQVFMNIISNAFQAIPDKGRVSIKVSYLSEDEKIAVQISDSGVGIKPEELNKIFDPFYTTKDVGQGTGLGLSISYGIVKSHGGEIQVESQIGQGTSFLVTFPVPKSDPHS